MDARIRKKCSITALMTAKEAQDKTGIDDLSPRSGWSIPNRKPAGGKNCDVSLRPKTFCSFAGLLGKK